MAEKASERGLVMGEAVLAELVPSCIHSLMTRLVEVAGSCSSSDVCNRPGKSRAAAMGSAQNSVETAVSQSTGNWGIAPGDTGPGENRECLEGRKMVRAALKTAAEADTVHLAGCRR